MLHMLHCRLLRTYGYVVCNALSELKALFEGESNLPIHDKLVILVNIILTNAALKA